MVDNDMEEMEERAPHKGNFTAAPDGSKNELVQNATVSNFISNIHQPRLNSSPRESPSRSSHSSHQSHQSHQQNSIGTQKVQGPPTVISPSPFQPRQTLAVHIKSSPVSSPSHRRRGRPPKDRSLDVQSGAERTPATSRAPSSTQNEVEGSSPQQKKRGRPKGWRPGMSYTDAIEGSSKTDSKPREPREPKKDQAGEQKRRGRPPRAVPPSAREQYLQTNAKYLPFLCEWKGSSGKTCPAELQNMKTLRKHVLIVHGEDKEPPLVCRWGKCAGKNTPIEFPGQTEFEEHMEKEHFRSFVWYMGDGYNNEGISTLKRDADGLPKYLFDENGNQVTPSIRDQVFEDDQQHKERRRKVKRLLLLSNENAPTDEEYTRQTLGLD
ncbi:hypothetical protein M434DRAFT_397705 [Hypoxylon sp. CO27-5]|nr:hypothetical protein M434DRAFT_397705 [Hypoxylon sp. CO27-5]